MPLLSTRASASSTGYGQNLISSKNIFTPGGVAPYVYDSENASSAPLDYVFTPDGIGFYVSVQVYLSGAYQWYINYYTKDVSTGVMTYIGRYLVPDILPGGSACWLSVSADGKNLYASISGSSTSTTDGYNQIHQFSIDNTTKAITALGTPVNLGTGAGVYYPAIAPDGKNLYVGSRSTNKIYILSRNTTTGDLTYSTFYTTPASTLPAYPVVTNDNSFLYAASYGTNTSNAMLQYSRSSVTGALTALSPEGVAGDVKSWWPNFNPAQNRLWFASQTGSTIYIYNRNPVTGVLTSNGSQGGTIGKVSFNSSGTILLGSNPNVSSGGSAAIVLTSTPIQGNVDPTTGAITGYSYPKLIALYGQSAFVIPSPTYDYYYTVIYGQNTVQQWSLTGGYLLPVNYPAPLGSALSVGYSGVNTNYTPTFTALSPDNKFLYANGYWPYGSTSGSTGYGSMFEIDPTTKIPTRATTGANSTEFQGAGGIVMSSDGAFFYILDLRNPTSIRQYSRNILTGSLTPLSTPTIALPNPLVWSSSLPYACFSYPVLSPDGKFLYVQFASADFYNQKISYIIQYSRDTVTGLLTLIGTVNVGDGSTYIQSWARDGYCSNISMTPDGKFMYAVGAKDMGGYTEPRLYTFSRNATTGIITQISELIFDGTGSSLYKYFTCISPDGTNLYLNNSYNIQIYSLDPTTGALTFVKLTPNLYVNSNYFKPLIMSPDGATLIQIVYSTTFTKMNIYNRNSSGDLILAATNKQFNAPAYMLQNGVMNVCFSSDSKKIYNSTKYVTYGTINK